MSTRKPLADSTCSVCAEAMIRTDEGWHPGCGPDGEFYRVEVPEHLRDLVLAAVAASAPELTAAGVKVISDYARTHRTFDPNDVRERMTAVGVVGPKVGAVFGQAARDGIIRRTDSLVKSKKKNTKAHHLFVWESRIYQGEAA